LPWMSDCIAGSSSAAPSPPTIAQKTNTARRSFASVMASAPTAYPRRPMTYPRLRPMRSPTLLLIRMNAAETSASSATADWTPLTVVSRSLTTDEIETFISEVSTTSTNMAAASNRANRPVCGPSPVTGLLVSVLTQPPPPMLPRNPAVRPAPERVMTAALSSGQAGPDIDEAGHASARTGGPLGVQDEEAERTVGAEASTMPGKAPQWTQ